MDILILIGRILFGALIVFAGTNHILQMKKSAAFARMKGVPMPELANIVTGLLLLFGGLSFFLGKWMPEGAIALLVFFIPVTLMMHNFWKIKDPQKKKMEMQFFMGNMMVVGLLLITLGLIQ